MKSGKKILLILVVVFLLGFAVDFIEFDAKHEQTCHIVDLKGNVVKEAQVLVDGSYNYSFYYEPQFNGFITIEGETFEVSGFKTNFSLSHAWENLLQQPIPALSVEVEEGYTHIVGTVLFGKDWNVLHASLDSLDEKYGTKVTVRPVKNGS